MQSLFKRASYVELALCATMLAFSYALFEHRPANSGEWSSWLQAAAAVVTFTIMIVFNRIDATRAETRKTHERESMEKGVKSIAEKVQVLLERIERGRIADELARVTLRTDLQAAYVKFVQHQASELHSILASMPIERLALVDLIDVVLYLRLAMSELERQVPYYLFGLQGCTLDDSSARVQFQHIQNNVDAALEKLGIGSRHIIDAAKESVLPQVNVTSA